MRKRRLAWLAAGAALAMLLWLGAGRPPDGDDALTPLWPIPGLDGGDCSHITPQGVCLGDHAVFVSAYCGRREHASRVYVLSRETGACLAAVPLGMRAHVGGLACRGDRLYVACGDGKAARVAVISASALRAAAWAGRPPKMDCWDLPDLARASFLTCCGDTLYVGTFSLTGNGVVGAYPLDETGAPAKRDSPAARCRTLTAIPDKVQGMTFCGDQILFSCSFGTGAASELLVFQERPGTAAYAEADAVRIALPPMLEQVAAEGDRLYLLFESAARQYRGRCAQSVDCICAADLPRLLEEVK